MKYDVNRQQKDQQEGRGTKEEDEKGATKKGDQGHGKPKAGSCVQRTFRINAIKKFSEHQRTELEFVHINRALTVPSNPHE